MDKEILSKGKASKGKHTTEHRTGIPTIDVCFDADRLDLGRVSIVPDPKLKATKQGAYYAANIHFIEQLNEEIE